MMKKRFIRLGAYVCMMACFTFMASAMSYSHGHRTAAPYAEKNHGPEGHDRGHGEATGVLAAWLLIIANFPVVLSVLAKTSAKLLPSESSLKRVMQHANGWQKRHFMKMHYWLNPLAVAAAFLHFLSTKCEATAIPELGLSVMLIICILGIMLTFRWAPASVRRIVFKLHTSPIMMIASVFILMIGHLRVD